MKSFARFGVSTVMQERKTHSKCLQFKVVNSFEANLSCQRRLLNQEISIKYKTIRTLNNKTTSIKNTLPNEMSFLDYVHVVTKFLVSNDKIRPSSKFSKTMVRNFIISF